MDRKAWIVVIVCSILLALNLHYTGENRRIAQEKEKAAEEEKIANTPAPDEPAGLTVEKPPIPEELGSKETRTLSTPTNLFTLSTLGGGIEQNELLEEKAVEGEGNITMNDLGENRIGALTRLSGESLEKGYYKPVDTGDPNSVTFKATTLNKLEATKTWTLANEGAGKDHRLTLTLTLTNPKDSKGEVSLSDMAIYSGSAAPAHQDERKNYLNFFWSENGDFDSETSGYFSSFFGADPTEFRKFLEGNVRFSGVENQFFATIISPKEPYPATYRAIPDEVEFPAARGGEKGPVFNTFLSLRDETIPAGQSKTYVFDIFMGPKNNALIRSLEGDKAEVMDYGFFGWISCPLNWLLNNLATLFGGENNPWSWGWAIVALTLIIRTFMWPLHAKSTRTMKRMSKLQPKIKALKEKYPDDPNKMNQEMMKLYKTFGVNPMGGCLPMLAQIPIFFGFYNMLQYAVELRNEPFLGWVKDLSQPDTVHVFDLPFGLPFIGNELPLNILPILMAVTMVIQMQLTPKTGDKLQRRIFMMMPLIFFFFCYNFASALALYWTVQNIFSIGQTWLMQKMPEPELKTSKNAGKETWMQKMAKRAEEAQKQRQAQQKSGRPGQKQAKPKKPRGPKTGG